MDVKEYLEHHGIKGQRWGIRHNPKTGRVTNDHRTVAELRRKPKPTLTNKQLQTVNTRLGLEQNFDRLNPSTVARGRNKANAILATVGIGVAVFNIVNSPAGKAAVSAGSKFIKRFSK